MATVNHTEGKCGCGHYHPKDASIAAVIDREWLETWTWATTAPGASWGTWVDLGRSEAQ